MKAIQLISQKKEIRFVEVPIPRITDANDVLIKVAYSGICGTDLHMIEGKFPVVKDRPLILGHEFSGTVVDFGKDVTIFKVGDKVAGDPNDTCLSCEWCHLGQPHFCNDNNKNLGTFKDGAWAEIVVLPVHMVHKLPHNVTLEQGALAEPLSCLSHGMDIVEPIPVGSKILITGAGIIGVLWACVCHLRGQRNVTVCEPNAVRLDIVRNLDLKVELVTPDALKAKSNELYDFCIDCSGNAAVMEYSVKLLRSGGTFLCFAVAPPDAEIKVNTYEMFMKETRIMGVKINPFSFLNAIRLIHAMEDRYLQYEKLGIKTYKLEEYDLALQDLKTGKVLKAVFKL
ncbi:uncharacterized protein LOC114324346 [Diabrotica virgifera virgifera]|uniref:D-arabinitol dehydrogenase 1-like n=1 Tax=Diabrotica virgifera virgifera TaxID=50390 RepID=A0A6P7F366_DIAVI|nr:uncharacterized protein LOC114324346 [Diabrotica virgifera virgifera]